MSLAHKMEKAELESQLRTVRQSCSQFMNVIEQIRIFLEEDDVQGALDLIGECYE